MWKRGNDARSRSRTRNPARAITSAAVDPAGPPPITSASRTSVEGESGVIAGHSISPPGWGPPCRSAPRDRLGRRLVVQSLREERECRQRTHGEERPAHGPPRFGVEPFAQQEGDPRTQGRAGAGDQSQLGQRDVSCNHRYLPSVSAKSGPLSRQTGKKSKRRARSAFHLLIQPEPPNFKRGSRDSA